MVQVRRVRAQVDVAVRDRRAFAFARRRGPVCRDHARHSGRAAV